MTSKELLEHIKNAPSFMGGDTRYEATTNSPDLYLEDIEQIKRDLEILETIKSHIQESKDLGIPLTGAIEVLLWFNGKEAETIKEWMKNE